MITGPIRAQIDRFREALWSGAFANPRDSNEQSDDNLPWSSFTNLAQSKTFVVRGEPFFSLLRSNLPRELWGAAA